MHMLIEFFTVAQIVTSCFYIFLLDFLMAQNSLLDSHITSVKQSQFFNYNGQNEHHFYECRIHNHLWFFPQRKDQQKFIPSENKFLAPIGTALISNQRKGLFHKALIVDVIPGQEITHLKFGVTLIVILKQCNGNMMLIRMQDEVSANSTTFYLIAPFYFAVFQLICLRPYAQNRYH